MPFTYHVAHSLVFAARKHVNLAVITVAKLAPRICGSAISASKLLNFQGPCLVLHDVTLLLKGDLRVVPKRFPCFGVNRVQQSLPVLIVSCLYFCISKSVLFTHMVLQLVFNVL